MPRDPYFAIDTGRTLLEDSGLRIKSRTWHRTFPLGFPFLGFGSVGWGNEGLRDASLLCFGLVAGIVQPCNREECPLRRSAAQQAGGRGCHPSQLASSTARRQGMSKDPRDDRKTFQMGIGKSEPRRGLHILVEPCVTISLCCVRERRGFLAGWRKRRSDRSSCLLTLQTVPHRISPKISLMLVGCRASRSLRSRGSATPGELGGCVMHWIAAISADLHLRY